MTSGNVSNIPVPNMVYGTKSNKSNSIPKGNDFQKVMTSSVKQTNDAESKASKDETTIAKQEKFQSKLSTVDDKKSIEPVKEMDMKDAKEILDEFEEETLAVFQEELGLTENELKESMELLGITAIDLLDKNKLMEFLSNITGIEDKTEMLLSPDLTNALSRVMELGKEVVQTLSQEQLSDLQTGYFGQLLESDAEITDQMNQALQKAEGMVVADDSITVETDSDSETSVETAQDSKIIVADERTMSEESVASYEKDGLELTDLSKSGDVLVTTNKEDIKEETDMQSELASQEGNEMLSGDLTSEKKEFPSEDGGNNRSSDANKNMMAAQMNNNIEVNAQQFQPVKHEIIMDNGQVVQVQRIMNQIVETTRVVISDQRTSVEMMLNPEGLGKLYMQLEYTEGEIHAKMVVENQMVKEALEYQLTQLKDQMNQQGLKVNEIEISVGVHEFEQNLEQEMAGEQQASQQESSSKPRNLNLNELDDVKGLLSEEEILVAKIMKEQGNSINFSA